MLLFLCASCFWRRGYTDTQTNIQKIPETSAHIYILDIYYTCFHVYFPTSLCWWQVSLPPCACVLHLILPSFCFSLCLLTLFSFQSIKSNIRGETLYVPFIKCHFVSSISSHSSTEMLFCCFHVYTQVYTHVLMCLSLLHIQDLVLFLTVIYNTLASSYIIS